VKGIGSGSVFEKKKLEDWHSEECKLTPILTFDHLTSNKMGDQDLSCTYYPDPPAKFDDDISSGFYRAMHVVQSAVLLSKVIRPSVRL